MIDILQAIQSKSPHEILFNNASSEFYETMKDYLHPSVLKVLLHPQRVHMFSVPWVDDSGQTQVNMGYRVQYNNAMGPYKGGIRFDPSVNLDVCKFLAFEQTFKNALTGLAMGGAKGGSDFNPKGKSDAEILAFCQSFINQIYQHLGSEMDVPAGDIGVGPREVGYMFGHYKQLTQVHNGTFTGKRPVFGGALGRPEATGYGLVYITQEHLNHNESSFKGKRVIVSGCGNVAIHAAYKAVEMGATVVAMSDRSGTLFDMEGLNIEEVQSHKAKGLSLKEASFAQFTQENTIWHIPCDIALPCATQSEMNEQDVAVLLANGCSVIAEGANRPLTPEAVQSVLQASIAYLPGKAANAGGVAVSGLEMSQNAQFTRFSFEEVDAKLHAIMKTIYADIASNAKQLGQAGNYLLGANYTAYKKLEEAILAQGVL